MRKNKQDDIAETIEFMYKSVDEEMQRLELTGFVDKVNFPRIKLLDEDDRIGVEEVLVIGGYLALSKLHSELHKDHDDMDTQIDLLFDGKATLKQVAPRDLPKEVLDALQNVVDFAKENRKKMRGDK